MKKKIIMVAMLLIALIVSGMAFADLISEDEYSATYVEKAKVLSVEDHESTTEGDFFDRVQTVELEITTGKFQGEVIKTENIISGTFLYDIPVEVGDKVLVHIDEYLYSGVKDVYVMDYVRDQYILYLVLFFILALIVVGKMKGFKTVLTIGLTVFMVYKVLLPALLQGYNPIPVTVFISIVITVVTILFISGLRKKSLAAIAGTMFGVLIAGLIAYYVGSSVRLTGLSAEEASMLMFLPQGITFDFKNLLFAGILLGALGAVMDVAMSIASSIEEIYKAKPDISKLDLFKSGMEVGKDVMGTMSNTLILAYTGSSIPLLLMFMAYDTPMIKMLNLDIVATEIIRALSGSIGLILTIPITAGISVALHSMSIKEKVMVLLEEMAAEMAE